MPATINPSATMRSGFINSDHRQTAGFTLAELLVASVVFLMMLAITLSVTSNVTRLTTEGTSSLAVFQEARTAFETLNRTLSQAVLNPYWDYDDPANPAHYLRASELHFILGDAEELTTLPDTIGSSVFFQAPLNTAATAPLRSQQALLNALGFYVRFSESEHLPPFLADRKPQTGAWRLWMFSQPTERFGLYSLYSRHPQAASDLSWVRHDVAQPLYHHVLANHVILLVISAGYQDATGQWRESYLYNSRGTAETSQFPQAIEIHQLPPVLNVTLVAIDPRTAERLLAQSEGAAYRLIPPTLFQHADRFRADLDQFQQHLNSAPSGIPIRYEVFQQAVKVTSSKWSR